MMFSSIGELLNRMEIYLREADTIKGDIILKY